MIATTIEQSKHLLELGLDPKTADMYYLPQVMNEGETLWPIDEGYDLNDADQPAWSLSALLEVMPPFIKGHHLKIEKTRITNMWYLDYQYLTDSEPRKDLLTAAYEMACWLLEQGLIEKGGQDE